MIRQDPIQTMSADLLELLTLALPYVEEGEEFNNPRRPKLSDRIRTVVVEGEVSSSPAPDCVTVTQPERADFAFTLTFTSHEADDVIVKGNTVAEAAGLLFQQLPASATNSYAKMRTLLGAIAEALAYPSEPIHRVGAGFHLTFEWQA